jgi:NAD(P)-dependent dehydrogenase (short-subunit alcohol dehydrogenase family)
MNLIVGGSSGLGNSLANCFAEDGKTIIVSRRNAKNTKDNIVHIGLDINTDNLDYLYDKIKENELSNIFFTVGLIDWKNDDIFLDTKKFEEIFQTNFLSIKKIISELIKTRKLNSNCLICFCSSASTILPRHRQITYCAAKSALNSFYKSLRTYLYIHGYKYRVANLILGYMNTEMNKNINLPFKKKNPEIIAKQLFKKRKTLEGIHYFPKYWLLIKLIVNFLPEKVLFKIIKTLNL